MPFLNKSTLNLPATSAFPNGIWQDTRNPTSNDYRNFNIGTEWINHANLTVWFMVNKTATTGTWIQAAGGSVVTETLTGNSGGAVGVDGANNINIIGAGTLSVAGNPGTNTLTISQSGSVATSYVEDAGSAIPSLGVLNILGAGGITTSGAGNTITISSTNTTTWQVIGASQTMAVDNGYICGSGGTLSLLLPATSVVGDIVEVTLDGSTGWIVTQAAGQQIKMSSSTTTLGAGGSLASTATGDTLRIVCRTANTLWVVLTAMGNITVV